MDLLTDLLASLNWTEMVLTTITGVGGVFLVWYRKKLAAIRAFWRDVGHGLRAIPTLQEDVRGIRYFVSPNGGGSLMDSAKRTEKAVAALTEQIDMIAQTMWAENDSDDEVGRFHADMAGETTYVNQLLARWLAVGKSELLGWNLFNYVHTGDAERVREHWDRCRAEHRHYHDRYRMMSAHGDSFEVTVTAIPIPEGRDVKRWVGSIRRVAVSSNTARRRERAETV